MHPDAYEEMYRLEKKHWWFCAKREFVRRVIARHIRIDTPEAFRILDCGCGTGVNLKFLSQFATVEGIDHSEIAVDYCRRSGFSDIVHRGDLQNLEAFDGCFDLVTALDVLYHRSIKDDVAVLEQIRSVLKAGGLLLITDSAFNFLKSSHDVALGTRERYTLGTLTGRLRRAGFEIVHRTYTFFSTFPLVAAVRMLKKRVFRPPQVRSDVRPVPEALNRALIFVLGLEAIFAARYCLPVGSSVLVLARKNDIRLHDCRGGH